MITLRVESINVNTKVVSWTFNYVLNAIRIIFKQDSLKKLCYHKKKDNINILNHILRRIISLRNKKYKGNILKQQR